MKALSLAPLDQASLDALAALLPLSYESWTETRRLADPEELAARLQKQGIGVLIIEADFAPAELFELAPALRLLAVCRNSVAHVDMAAATRQGVAVVNAPGRNTQAVAELTLGLLLALARQIPRLDSLVKGGQWRNPVGSYLNENLRGAELAGHTLGVVGLGQIGRQVAQLAAAFGMAVAGYDPKLSPEAATSLSKSVQRLSSLPELLGASDYLTLHVPPGPDTQDLLNARMLALTRPGCHLVNTSFAGAVSEAALAEALRTGRLAGAALDVFETHPIRPDSPLLTAPNVILTPHMGGATAETVRRHSQAVVQDIARFVQGQRPRNLVNPEVWPVHA